MSKISQPKFSNLYGSYKWHSAWVIDEENREARHKSGVVYDFSPGIKGAKKPPLGGRCPENAWKGELRDGQLNLQKQGNEALSVRLCLEACSLFSTFAWDMCLDCSKHTAGNDYYMVQNKLWAQAHPNLNGMLCLSCLKFRIGRPLIKADFTEAPTNYLNPSVVAIMD